MIKIQRSEILLLLLAIACLILSEYLWFKDSLRPAIFVGLWVPSILGFAIYLKLLKIDNK